MDIDMHVPRPAGFHDKEEEEEREMVSRGTV